MNVRPLFRLGVFVVLVVLAVAAGGVPAGAAIVTDVPGSVLWLDASQIPVQANNTTLATWADQSAAGTNSVSQATVAAQPRYVDAANGLNGRPVVRFDGAQAMFSGSVPSFDDFTLFAVYQFDTLGSDRIVVTKYDYPTNNREWAFFYNSNNLRLRSSGNGTATSDMTFGLPPTGSFNVESLRKQDAAATAFRNGASLSVGGTVVDTLHHGNSHFSVGAVNASTPVSTLDGSIAEAIVYDRPVNAAERIVLENYLSSKYNVGAVLSGSDRALAANDFYAGDTTAKGNHDLDVFGIGRSGGASLAGSSAAGLALAESGGSLDNNGEFVLAGHAAASNAWTSADMLGLGDLDARWERVWYLDTTGGVNASLLFDFAGGGIAPPDAADVIGFSLLYSPTNAFNFTVAQPSGAFDGNNVAFLLADGFADGYYTLGVQYVPEPGSLALGAVGALILLPLVRRARRREAA